MTPPSSRQEPPRGGGSLPGLLASLAVLTVIGVTVAEVARNGHVDSVLVGALTVLAFGFLGYGTERTLEGILDRIFGGRR